MTHTDCDSRSNGLSLCSINFCYSNRTSSSLATCVLAASFGPRAAIRFTLAAKSRLPFRRWWATLHRCHATRLMLTDLVPASLLCSRLNQLSDLSDLNLNSSSSTTKWWLIYSDRHCAVVYVRRRTTPTTSWFNADCRAAQSRQPWKSVGKTPQTYEHRSRQTCWERYIKRTAVAG